jgi:nucleotide-binding universal stress UspA family protein
MHPFVAAVDGSLHSKEILRWADREASLAHAPLIALSAYEGDRHSGTPADAAAQRLDACVESALPSERAAHTRRVVLPDRPFDAMIKASVESDLLVMGVHRHRIPWTPHDLAARVVALATCPVAMVPERSDGSVQRIAVGVDGSPASLAALRWAARRARRSSAALIAVMAWHWVPEYSVFPYGPSEDDAERDAAELLDRAVGRLPALRCTRMIDQGHPTDVLLDVADEVDLLVVGSTGTGSFRNQLLGSVSQRVAQRASCPVVVVHEADGDGWHD